MNNSLIAICILFFFLAFQKQKKIKLKKWAFIFILFTALTSAQTGVISKYEKSDVKQEGLEIIKILKIEDNNLIILRLDDVRYITFDLNRNVTAYCILNNAIQKEIVDSELALESAMQLDSLKSINPYNLTIESDKSNDTITDIHVEDGYNASLNLFYNNKKIEYSTYSPQTYIDNKFPFYKDRLRLNNAISFFNSLFKNQKCFERCDLIEAVLSDKEILKYLHHKKRNRKILYLVKNNLCSSNFALNLNYNVVIIDIKEINKYRNYIVLNSFFENSISKKMELSYPIENLFIIAIFDHNNKLLDVKISKR